MPVLIIGGILALLALIFGPQLWIKRVLKQNQVERDDLGGTGSDLARHLLDSAGLRHVKVELTATGDHYDPTDETVRLTVEHYDGRSVAALAVAAHEVGHAMQQAEGSHLFNLRIKLAPSVIWVERFAQIVFFAIPLLGIYARSPSLIAAQVALVVMLMGARLFMHVITLPVELDASFKRALPILQAGQFVPQADMAAATRVLRAAALTYVAAALVSLIDVTRFLRILR